VSATEAHGDPIEAILVDHEISPSQARNLEKGVGCELMDRIMVILEIFQVNRRGRRTGRCSWTSAPRKE